MFRVTVLGESPPFLKSGTAALEAQGFTLREIGNIAVLTTGAEPPDLVLLTIADETDPKGINETARALKRRLKVPLIALIPESSLRQFTAGREIDDFIVLPGTINELALRLKRLLTPKKTADPPELTRYGDLSLNAATCEVCLRDRPLALTFKEYELLKHLAANSNRVFSREALLNEVWGYDFYGGDRTVDVHVRRLRSKLECEGHTFIDTVRNVGYRFRMQKPAR